jgi:hypothetical protein
MSDTGPDDPRRRMSLRTTRMEALSDGIFATRPPCSCWTW